jgi:hypothetical protein
MELPVVAIGIEVVHEDMLRRVFNDIGGYAKKHGLDHEQVRKIFEAGLVAAYALGVHSPDIAPQKSASIS